MKKIALIVSVLFVLTAAPAAAKQPEGLHCPGHNDPANTKYEDPGNDIVLEAGTEFCVKGGPQDATGVLVADGTQTIGDYLPGKYDVSYYVVYGKVVPPEEPKPKPNPEYPLQPAPEPPKVQTPAPPTQQAPPTRHKKVDPRARFIGPCGDPYYAAVFNNKRSERAVTFRFIYIGRNGMDFIKRTVQPGKFVKTRFVWVKGDSTMRIRRGNGENLRIIEAAPPGFYGWEGACAR